jgi:hypothetical protein
MPIIRGYILPKRGLDNSPVYIESFDDETGKKMFEELADLIKGALDSFTDNGKNKICTVEDLSLFLDSLVSYFKSLAFIDPIPIEAISTQLLPTSQQSLYLYLSKRELLKKFGVKPYERKGLDKLDELLKYAGDVAKLYSEEKRERFYDVLRFPADTRPGCNTSSLLIHSLTASALSSAYYIESNGIDENLLIVRFAALFHDIGKFLNWKEHEALSVEKVRSLFEAYVDGHARKVILDAEDLIIDRKHILRSFLDYGDTKSSSLDRIAELFYKVIRNTPIYGDLEKCLKEYAIGSEIDFNRAFNDWNFWINYVKEDLVKKLTEEFCKRASEIHKGNVVFDEKSVEVEVDENIAFIRIDIRRIQQFIKVNNIWAMNGASRLIDMILYTGIPSFIVDELKLPLESVLYFGGGNVTIVVPKSFVNKIKELINHFNNEFFKGSSSKLVFGLSPFYSNFRLINSTIDNDLAAKKIGYAEPQHVNPNIYEKCELCGKDYALLRLNKREERVCNTCKDKHEFGEIWHFRVRAKFLGLNWDELSKYVVEYVSGHSRHGPEPGEEYLSLSMIKFDGILIGQIMSSSISLTDACERSFRIDLSVKKGIRSFMKQLLDLNEKEDFNRMVLGLMYVGGDDGVMLMPSRLSIPFALHLMNEYYLNMGCKNALSLGLIAAKPKHPLSHLYEACDSLLDIAKGARNDCYENLHKVAVTTPSDSFRGSLTFFSTDGGWATGETVKSIINEAFDEGISCMKNSYLLSGAASEKAILKLLNVIEYDMKIDLNNLTTERLLKIVGEGDTDGIKEEKIRRLKELRNCIHDIFSSSKIKIRSKEIEFIYAVKEANSAQSDLKRNFMKEIVSQVFRKINHNVNLNLYDLFLLIKILGGGRL